MKTTTEHTPTRCNECKWVHEADTIKRTSYLGVEFCPAHDRAVKSYDELVGLLIHMKEYLDGDAEQPGIESIKAAIAKAEGKV